MNPNDVEVEIPEGETLQHNGECIVGPATITVNKYAASKFFETIRPPLKTDKCCFPELCRIGDSWPIDVYRNQITLAPGEKKSTKVPAPEGCSPPSKVWIQKCGGCIYVDYDKEVSDAAEILDGTAPDLNPTLRYLYKENNECVEDIHFFNPGLEPVIISLSYYC